MGHVADGDGTLLLHIGQERSLVVDHEVKDAVVIRNGERDLVDALGFGRGALLRLESQTMERREHAELELQLVIVGDLEAEPLVPDPLRDGDGVLLDLVLVRRNFNFCEKTTYRSVVDTVDTRVGHIAELRTLVLNRVDAQVANLLEGPASGATGKLLVPRLDGRLLTRALDLGVEPLVLESLCGSHNGEASRVARLES